MQRIRKSKKISERYILCIPKSEINKIFNILKGKPNESCGVLIGKKLNKQKYSLTNIIHDNKPIDPSKFGVTRNTKNVYPYVNAIVENSEDDIDYIGEWHSHLNGNCNYSNIDLISMRELMRDPDYKFPVFLILIILKFPDQIKAYLFKKQAYQPKNMEINIDN